MKFKAVLDDLPDQPRGIIVSRAGFQSGARAVAAANGILLYELRHPNETDLKNRVRSVDLKLTTYHPKTSGIRLFHDNEWRISEARRLGLTEAPRLNLQLEPGESELMGSDGEIFGTIQGVINDLYPKGFCELQPMQVRHDFAKPTFLVTHNRSFPKLKLSALEATISVSALDQEIIVSECRRPR